MRDNKTVLITGGAGFIGSHTCKFLLGRDRCVVSVDNFSDNYSPEYKRENIKCVQRAAGSANNRFESFEGDIRDAVFLDGVFRETRPDIVIHLAACAGVRSSVLNPGLYADVNVNGTVNILECMKNHGIGKLLFASSSSVYGNNAKLPFCESDPADRPLSPYAATKRAGELICHTYHHLYDINIACLRFFTVYGPGQRPDLAIYRFTESVLKGKPITFYGDGSSERDYTFIEDIIDGIWRAAIWADNGEKRFDVFNLGGSAAVTLSETVAAIESEAGVGAVLDFKPQQPWEVYKTSADISHSKAVLGYNPGTEFKKGIKAFVDWYKRSRL